jgi:hypothetical protein
VWYVDHWSLGLDIRILLLTIWRVLRSEGVKSGQDVREVDDIGLNAGLSRAPTEEGQENKNADLS